MNEIIKRVTNQAPAVAKPGELYLGNVRPLDPDNNGPLLKAMQEMVARAWKYCGPEPLKTDDGEDHNHKEWLRRRPISYEDYSYFAEGLMRGGRLRRELEKNHKLADADTAESKLFVREIYNQAIHSPNPRGYGSYLAALNDVFGNRLVKLQEELHSIALPETLREMHTLIVGRSGAGKSELIKLIVHHYVKHPELGAVVVLDPQGKLVQEIGRWREFAGEGSKRLVYLDAELDRNAVPALNPIIMDGVSDASQLATKASQLADALAFLAGEGEGQTSYMQRLGTFSIRVMLDSGGSFYDLYEALTLSGKDRDRNVLIRAGRAHSNPIVASHFNNEFFADNYKAARAGLAARLSGALFIDVFRHMMTASQPIDLETHADAGKIILANCGSAQGANALLGRLLIAQLVSIGMRRVTRNVPNPLPLHIIVDEATMLMAPPIFTALDQLRKGGIRLTMVQQGLGDSLSADERRSIATKPQIKMIGSTDGLGPILKQIGWEIEPLPQLTRGQWLTRWGNDNQPIVIDTNQANYLADGTNAMNDADWQAVKAQQLATFYRNLPAGDAGEPAGSSPALAKDPPGDPAIKKSPARSRGGFSVPPPPDKRWRD